MGLGKKANPQGSSGFNFNIRLLQLLGQSVDFNSKAATESTLLSVLNAIEISKDFELLLVRDQGDGDVVVQQIRERDQGTGTWVTRYEKADGSPHTVVGPLKYLDPSAILNLMLTELNDQGLTLDDILITLDDLLNTVHLEVDDDAIAVEQELPTNINLLYGAFEGEGVEWERIQTDGDGRLKGIYDILLELGLIKTNTNDVATQTTLAALEAKFNSLGQKASAASAPVVLSTEQEALLNSIKTAVENIDLDLGTGGLNLEATQLLIKAVLDTIKLDTAKLDVNLSTRATEATLLSVLSELQGINLDTNGLNQEATQLLVKGVLDTIDAVLDSIKLDTGAMVIDLAAIEVLITSTNSLLTTIDGVLDTIKLDTAAIATDIAAVETELLDQGTSLDAMVTDLAAIETELLDQGTVLDTIDADTSALATPVTNVAMGLIRATDATGSPIAAGKRRISVYNAGGANGSILGVAGNIKPGESLTFSADGLRDTLAAFAYDGTGTELVITTIG